MKTNKLYLRLILLVFPILLGLQLNSSFAQTVVFSQNFNSPGTLSGCGGGSNASSKTGTFNTGATGIYAGNENLGDYATICAGACASRYAITNNSDECAAANADSWKTQTNTGNDGGGFGDYAMIIDGCASCAADADASVWCVTIPVTTNDIYNFSASYSSPWLGSKGNDPGLYLTINGVKLGSTAIVDQSLSSSPTTPQPYNLQSCYYQIPAGFSATNVEFCINMIQTSGGSDAVIGSGTYGTHNGQGNDFEVDDITITKYTSGTTSGCTYTGPTATPVELLSFSVKKEGYNAALEWITASERNSSYFSVEKSDDGIHYYEIGTVNAQGNSSNQTTYEFEDRQFNSTSYYRLKMVDQDASVKYSKIVILLNDDTYCKVSKKESGELEIRVNAQQNTNIEVIVYSFLGQKYAEDKIELSRGANVIVRDFSLRDKNVLVRIIASGGEVLYSGLVPN